MREVGFWVHCFYLYAEAIAVAQFGKFGIWGQVDEAESNDFSEEGAHIWWMF